MSTAYTHWLSYEEFVESYSVLAPSCGGSAQRRKTRDTTEVGEASISGVGSVAIVLCVCVLCTGADGSPAGEALRTRCY